MVPRVLGFRVFVRQTVILGLVLATGIMAGCGFTQAQSVTSSEREENIVKVKTTMIENEEDQLVPINAVKFDGNNISAGVISFGCTTSADFVVEHAVVNGLCEIRINRINRDLCRRAPFVANIVLEWSQPDGCRDLNLVVANPLLMTSDDNTIRKQMK